MSSVLPAICSAVIFVLALWRLPLLHPVQLWSGSWTFSCVLYALRLLPYRDLSWLTAALLCGSLVTFTAGALIGDGVGRRWVTARRVANGQVIRFAGGLALALLAVFSVAFVLDLSSRFGIAHVVRISPQVKAYLAGGEAPFLSVYVEVAIAASVICALASTRAEGRISQRLWLLGALAAVALIYFSTSRAFILMALIASLGVLLLAAGAIPRRRLVAGVIAVTLVAALIFVGLGSVLGKTYGSSTIGQFDNFFSEHPALSSLALPYEDATASLPALDLLTHASSTWGVARGCASVPIACGVLRKAGVPAPRVPVTGPFTSVPLSWNGYTFLEKPLLDGGTALALVLVAIVGLMAGFVWSFARGGSMVGVIVYAISLPALVAAYRQNLVELVVVTSIIALAVYLLARILSDVAAPLAGRLQGQDAASP
jgi:oligosaccharide repeat unit polymerase